MSDAGDFLDTAEGEVSLFRSIMRTRPVGIHRHVHILAIHNSIYRDTGFKVPMQDIWAKLGKMYDLDVLEHGVSSLVPLHSQILPWSWLTYPFLNPSPIHLTPARMFALGIFACFIPVGAHQRRSHLRFQLSISR